MNDTQDVETARRTASAPRTGSTCNWKPCVEEPFLNTWSTECNGTFEFTYDGPEKNEFKFCPYCGGSLVELKGEA